MNLIKENLYITEKKKTYYDSNVHAFDEHLYLKLCSANRVNMGKWNNDHATP